MGKIQLFGLALLSVLLLSSCDLVEGIFKAGVFGGILLTVLIIGLIWWMIRKVRD